MSRIAYVNGLYLPKSDSYVHIEDRGYQFADGIYEVVPISQGDVVDEEGHLDRLYYSLQELRIAAPCQRQSLKIIIREIMRRNKLAEGMVYIQVTRGVAPRNHVFPKNNIPASLVVYAQPKKFSQILAKAEKGVTVITVPDQRWKRCDIKSIALLPNILAKQAAEEQGAYEAWQLDEKGYITEGSSSSAWIVNEQGVLITPPGSRAILNGITRLSLLQLAQDHQMKIEERAFHQDELKTAQEAFISSASNFCMPVVKVNDRKIGDGVPGPLGQKLLTAYLSFMAGHK